MKGNARKAGLLAFALAGFAGSHQHAIAGELLPLEEIPTITPALMPFCASYGDFYACSTAVLNFVTNGGVNLLGQIVAPNTNQVNGAFKVIADQGLLGKDSVITVYGGSGAVIDNPTIGLDDLTTTDVQENLVMDDAYSSSSGQKFVTGFSTNKTPSAEELAAGVQVEPDPNSEGPPDGAAMGNADDDFAGDTNDYWDIQLDALLTGLTKDGKLRDPVFAFDNNQVGEDADASIKLWGVLALRDLDGTLPDKIFEFRGCNQDVLGGIGEPAGSGGGSDPTGCAPNSQVLNPNNNETVVDPTVFTSDKALGDDPLLDEYALVQGEYCVDTNFTEVLCDGNEAVRFNQNLGTNLAEFFGFLPELTGAKLKGFRDLGYDVLSMDLRFFDQSNGFEDLFILAMGERNTTPEPGSLALLGIAGMGFAALRRRRQSA